MLICTVNLASYCMQTTCSGGFSNQALSVLPQPTKGLYKTVRGNLKIAVFYDLLRKLTLKYRYLAVLVQDNLPVIIIVNR